MLRPWRSVSLSISMALAAESTVSISTMPHPLERPPGPSVRILVWITSPAWRKWSLRSCHGSAKKGYARTGGWWRSRSPPRRNRRVGRRGRGRRGRGGRRRGSRGRDRPSCRRSPCRLGWLRSKVGGQGGRDGSEPRRAARRGVFVPGSSGHAARGSSGPTVDARKGARRAPRITGWPSECGTRVDGRVEPRTARDRRSGMRHARPDRDRARRGAFVRETSKIRFQRRCSRRHGARSDVENVRERARNERGDRREGTHLSLCRARVPWAPDRGVGWRHDAYGGKPRGRDARAARIKNKFIGSSLPRHVGFPRAP